MSGLSLDVKLDQKSLRRLYAFENYQAVFEPALYKAMDRGISIIQAVATDYMQATFKNPGRGVEEAWETEVQGPYLATLSNTAPYAQRLVYGFSGMTDALGRYYPYWPAYYWAGRAIVRAEEKVKEQFEAAIDYANASLGREV